MLRERLANIPMTPDTGIPGSGTALKLMPVAEAFAAAGLRHDRALDRRLWEYFISPLIRVAVTYGAKTQIYSGPYRVGDNGEIERLRARPSLPDPYQLPKLSPGPEVLTQAQLLQEDVDRALECPYVFDSMATTALKVGTRQVYAYIEKSQRDVTEYFAQLPEPPVSGCSRAERIAYRLASNKAAARANLDQDIWVLGDAAQAQRALAPLQWQCSFLNDPWVLREDRNGSPTIAVAPLFQLHSPDPVPEQYRDPWWFERLILEFQGMEYEAEQGVKVNPAIRPDRIDELRQLTVGRMNLGGDPFSRPSPIKEMRPAAGWMGAALVPQTLDRRHEFLRSLVHEFFFGCSHRIRVFLRGDLHHVVLHEPGKCIYSGCDEVFIKAKERSRGRKPIYCVNHQFEQERLERKRQREFLHRRRRTPQS